MNPTIKKVKKKRKGKKVTVDVFQPSFFTFFDEVKMPNDNQLKQGDLTMTRKDIEEDTDTEKKNEDEEDAGPKFLKEDIGERLDRDYQLGQDFKDELIPLAYEYFLNVIDHQSDDESLSDEDEEHNSEPKPKKEKKKKTDEENCKQ